MKYYLIAGEASGDLHGSNLIKAIHQKDSTADIRCWGGDKMKAAGARLVKHYRELAFMGFAEVLFNLRTIFKNMQLCKDDITAWKPDVLVFIDYPGFNIRIAEWAKPLGYKTVWYISPQVWAWKASRVKILRRCIDKMLCILPFEKEFYQQWQYEVEYVGHPLIEVIKESKKERQLALTASQQEDNNAENASFKEPVYDPRFPVPGKDPRPIIALLPGSRRQEVLKKLPVMLKVARKMPHCQFIVAKAPGLEDDFYKRLVKQFDNVTAVRDATYPLLQRSTAALVTSGTATLETALFGVPQVVCYKGNPISYQIAKRLIKIRFISLVNLIMDKEVVKELIQGKMNVKDVQAELEKILDDAATIVRIKKDYDALWNLLSAGGNASEKAANAVVEKAYEKD